MSAEADDDVIRAPSRCATCAAATARRGQPRATSSTPPRPATCCAGGRRARRSAPRRAGEFGEPHAPRGRSRDNQQGITVCFALSHHEGEDHTIDRPADYDFWRAYRPDFWPGPLLGFLAPDPRTLEPVPRTFVPNPDLDPSRSAPTRARTPGTRSCGASGGSWRAELHRPGAFDSDITLVNWPLNDYWLKPSSAAARDRKRLHEARQLSLLGPVLAADRGPAPRRRHRLPGPAPPPGRHRHRGRPRQGAVRPRVAPDQGRDHRHRAARRRPTSSARTAAPGYRDSVGVGSYRIDLHPSTGGDNYIDISSLPFQIPLGALSRAASQPAARLQEHRHHPHHQRLLPAAPRRVEHRRGRRRARRALPGRGRRAAAGAGRGQAVRGVRAAARPRRACSATGPTSAAY